VTEQQDLWDAPHSGEAVDIEAVDVEADAPVSDAEPQDANQATDSVELVEPPD